jgi:Bacterial dnaA protein helix-turn-helix
MTKTEELVIETCADVFGVTILDILSKKRNREIVNARHCIIFILRNKYRLSYSEIGRLMNRDHTSIMYAIDVFEKYMANDDDIRESFNKVYDKLGYYKNTPHTRIVIHFKKDNDKIHRIVRSILKRDKNVEIEIL